jgi:hypothetical protein
MPGRRGAHGVEGAGERISSESVGSAANSSGNIPSITLEVVSQSTGGCGRPPRPMASSRTLQGIHRFPYEIRSSPSTPGARPRLPVICATTSTGTSTGPSRPWPQPKAAHQESVWVGWPRRVAGVGRSQLRTSTRRPSSPPSVRRRDQDRKPRGQPRIGELESPGEKGRGRGCRAAGGTRRWGSPESASPRAQDERPRFPEEPTRLPDDPQRLGCKPRRARGDWPRPLVSRGHSLTRTVARRNRSRDYGPKAPCGRRVIRTPGDRDRGRACPRC